MSESRLDSSRLWRLMRSPFVIGMCIVAGTVALMAAFIDTQTWIDFFSHPAQRDQELTRQGATLFRIMLGVTAAMVFVVGVIFQRSTSAKAAMHRPVSALSHKRQLLVLFGLVAIALAIRATRINESLWYDEIASWMTYNGGAPTLGAVVGNFLDPINHPFHTLVNTLSVRWLSDIIGIEPAFRLPALLFSLLSVVAMFGLMRSVQSERAAFIAAALTAILPVSVLEGVEARGYSMVIFFATMMTWLLIEARRRNQPWLWVMYAVVCALGIWSHFVTAFVPIGHGVWMIWRGVRHQEWRIAALEIISLLLGAAITLTLYSPMIPGMLASRGMFAAVRETQPTIVSAEGLHALLQLGGSWYWWAALPGLLLILLGFLRTLNWPEQHSHILKNVRMSSSDAVESNVSTTRVVELTMIGLPLMVIVVALSGTWMYARFTFFAFPGAIVLIALGVNVLWNRHRTVGIMAMCVICIASIADLAIRPPKQPLRDAAAYVRAHRDADDQMLVVGLAHEVQRLYANDLNLTYTFRHGEGDDLPRKLITLQPRWIVIEYPDSVSSATYDLLKRAGYEQVARFDGWADWTNGDVLVWSKAR